MIRSRLRYVGLPFDHAVSAFLEDVEERGLSEKTRLVYISHPNHPTGATMTREEMERLVAAVEGAGAWLVADAYRPSPPLCSGSA